MPSQVVTYITRSHDSPSLCNTARAQPFLLCFVNDRDATLEAQWDQPCEEIPDAVGLTEDDDGEIIAGEEGTGSDDADGDAGGDGQQEVEDAEEAEQQDEEQEEGEAEGGGASQKKRRRGGSEVGIIVARGEVCNVALLPYRYCAWGLLCMLCRRAYIL